MSVKQRPIEQPIAPRPAVVRIAAEIVLFAGLIAGTAVLIQPLQAELVRRLAAFRDGALAKLEAVVGYRVEYASIGPSLLGTLDLRGVRLVGAADGSPLTVERVRVGFSLSDVLAGRYLEAVRSLRFDAPTITIDAALNARLVALLVDAQDPDASPLRLPAVRLAVRGASLAWTDGRTALTVAGIAFDAAKSREGLALRGRSRLRVSSPAFPAELGEVAADFAFQGEIAADLRSGRWTVDAASLRAAAFELRSQTLLLTLDADRLELRKIKDRAPFDFTARYSWAAGGLSVEAAFDGFAPRRFLDLSGAFAAYGPGLDAELTGRADFSASAAGVSYGFDLAAKLPPQLVPGVVAAAAAGSGDTRSIRLDSASADLPGGRVAYAGTIEFGAIPVSAGRITAAGYRLVPGFAVSGSADLATRGLSASIYADTVTLGSLELAAVEASGELVDGQAEFRLAALRFVATADYADVKIGRIGLEGSFAPGQKFLQASVALDSVVAGDLADFAAPFLSDPGQLDPVRPYLDDITFTTEIFVTSDLAKLSYNAPRLVAAYAGHGGIAAIAGFSGTNESVDVHDLSVIWPGGNVSGSFGLDFADPADIAFSAEAAFLGQNYRASGMLLDGRTLSLQGNYGLQANLNLGKDFAFVGSVSAVGLPVPFGGEVYNLGVSADLRWVAGSDWSADFRSLKIEKTRGWGERPLRLSVAGTADVAGAVLTDLRYDDGLGELAGGAEFAWSADLKALRVDASLSDSLGSERYALAASFRDGKLDADLTLSRARAVRVIDPAYDAVASGEFKVVWSGAADYGLDARLDELNLNFGGKAVGLSGRATVDPDAIRVTGLKAVYDGFRIDSADLSIDRSASTAAADIRLRGSSVGRDVDASGAVALNFSPIADWTGWKAAADRLSGSLRVDAARLGAIKATEAFSFALAKDGDRIDFSGGPRGAVRFSAAAGGAFYADLSAPSPVRGTIIGSLIDNRIDARVSNFEADFVELWRFMPEFGFNLTGGNARGVLAVSGSAGDPDIKGNLRVTGCTATLPAWVDGTIGPVSADVVFDGSGCSFGPVSAPVNVGKASLSGAARFDRWLPSDFRLDIAVPRTTPVLGRANVSGLVAHGAVTGNMSVGYGSGGLDVSGQLTVENTLITLNPAGFAKDQNDAPAPLPLTVDIDLRTGRKVEFAWPSEDFPILRGYTAVGDQLRLAFDGMTGRYSIIGDVSLRGGEVYYFQRSFYLRSGMLRFNENQLRFDPKIAVRAEIRDRNEAGPVTLALVVDEAPLTVFTPRLESDPPLSQLEIISFLGQSLFTVDSATGGVRLQDAFLAASSDFLAQFNVIRVFERTARDFLNLDMFSIRTQILQNAVFGAAGLRSQPVDRNGGLGNYFDNTTVYMGKYLGADLFFQAIAALQYDPNKSHDLFGGLKPELDIGLELKTPFFLLKWSFLPTHGEHLFIDDHSVSLSWKKSF